MNTETKLIRPWSIKSVSCKITKTVTLVEARIATNSRPIFVPHSERPFASHNTEQTHTNTLSILLVAKYITVCFKAATLHISNIAHPTSKGIHMFFIDVQEYCYETSDFCIDLHQMIPLQLLLPCFLLNKLEDNHTLTTIPKDCIIHVVDNSRGGKFAIGQQCTGSPTHHTRRALTRRAPPQSPVQWTWTIPLQDENLLSQNSFHAYFSEVCLATSSTDFHWIKTPYHHV